MTGILEKIGASFQEGQKDAELLLTARSPHDVLIVEDDPIQIEVLREFLLLLRYRVRAAETGLDALRMIEESAPDLILLDVHLPDMDGLDLLDRIRQVNQDPCIILVSTDKSPALLIDGLTRGAEEFLQKPLSFDELAIRVQSILEIASYRKKADELHNRLEGEKQLLSRYFSSEIADSILNEDVKASSRDRIRLATVLVFDLRNSTGLAEKLGPLDFADFLNMIIVDLMDIVMAEGGSIVRMTGDGLIVTFADPLRTGAREAVMCARRITEHFRVMREANLDAHSREIAYGMGIATGRIFAGEIGTFRRLEFTIVGDALARATHLESLTKRIDKSTLVDLPTRNCSGERDSLEPVKVRMGNRTSTIYAL